MLPIDRCSRSLVPRIRAQGYEVSYSEFDGPHTVPQEMVREAFTTAWDAPRKNSTPARTTAR